MPYKRKYKKRRPRRRRRKTTLVRQPKAIADSQLCYLTYADFVSLDPGAGGVATALYLANGLFDPTVALGGHQPLGFDQWATFYNHYVVIGSKISVKFVSSDTTPKIGSALVAISLQDDTTLSTSAATELIERTGVNYAIMGTANATATATVSQTFSAKKFFNVSDIKDRQATLGATVLADPVEQAIYHISAGAVDNSSNPSILTAIVKIRYAVIFSERKTLSPS